MKSRGIRLRHFFSFLLAIVLFDLCLSARSQQALANKDNFKFCSQVREQYQQANEPLIVRSAADAKRYEKINLNQQTTTVSAVLENAIIKLLNERPNLSAQSLKSFLVCVQKSDEYDNWAGMTNSPEATRQFIDPHQVFVVSFWVYRGYSAVPDLKPYVVFFRKDSGSWRVSSETGAFLSGHTFYLSELQNNKHELTILLFGNRIGDTGTSLSAEVIQYDGTTLRSLWKRTNLPRQYVTPIAGARFEIEREELHDGKLIQLKDLYELSDQHVHLLSTTPDVR